MKSLLTAAVLGIFVCGGIPVADGDYPAAYPIIKKVAITTRDGEIHNPVDPVEIEAGRIYTLTAVIQEFQSVNGSTSSGSQIPENWELLWGSNFGEFPETPQKGNKVEWTAPEEEGEVVFQVRLQGPSDAEHPVYEKSFRIFVGEYKPWPRYDPHTVNVRFQDWCDEECVEIYAENYPVVGIVRKLAGSVNIWKLELDEEVDEHEAAREITWWPAVRNAEVDIAISLTDPGSIKNPLDEGGIPVEKDE